jgi:hypothetical protein
MLRLSQQAGTLPARMYLQDIVREIPFSTNPVEGPTPTARMVSSFCQQFGLQPMKDRKGRWVLFDPAAHAQVLEQFALAAEGGEERAA